MHKLFEYKASHSVRGLLELYSKLPEFTLADLYMLPSFKFHQSKQNPGNVLAHCLRILQQNLKDNNHLNHNQLPADFDRVITHLVSLINYHYNAITDKIHIAQIFLQLGRLKPGYIQDAPNAALPKSIEGLIETLIKASEESNDNPSQSIANASFGLSQMARNGFKFELSKENLTKLGEQLIKHSSSNPKLTFSISSFVEALGLIATTGCKIEMEPTLLSQLALLMSENIEGREKQHTDLVNGLWGLTLYHLNTEMRANR